MSAGGWGCWCGHRGGEVLRQELCAQELKGQVAAHNLRADKVNYSGGGRTGKKCRFYILNYRIAGDGARSDYLPHWIKKLKTALIRIRSGSYQPLVLLITGVRKTYLQFLILCGLASLADCNIRFPEQTVFPVFCPQKGLQQAVAST